MAEVVTLAKLVVDTQGVTQGVSSMGNSLVEGASVVQGFGATARKAGAGAGELVGKLFDLKQAFVTFAGAVGIVGIASLVATLTRNLVANSEAWKTFTKAAEDAFRALVLGETDMQNVIRSTNEFRQTLDFLKEEPVQLKMEKLTESLKTLRDHETALLDQWELLHKGEVAFTQLGAAMAAGYLTQQDVANAKSKLAKEAFGKLFAELQRTKIAIREGEAEWVKLSTALGQVQEPAVRVTSAIVALQDRLAATKITTIEYGRSILDAKEFHKQFAFSTTELFNIQAALNAELRETSRIMQTLPQLLGLAGKKTDELTEATELQLSAWKAITVAMQSAGAAIAQAFLEGGSSVKEVIGKMLKDIARMLIIESLMWVARAIIAASSPIGAATYGDPKALLLGAAKLAAAAAAAGIASKAVGGGGGGEEPVGGPFAAPTAVTAPIQNIQVIVEGSLLGVTPEQLGRDLADLVNRGVRDGVVLDGNV